MTTEPTNPEPAEAEAVAAHTAPVSEDAASGAEPTEVLSAVDGGADASETPPSAAQPAGPQPAAPQPAATATQPTQPTQPLPAEPWLTPPAPPAWSPSAAAPARPPIRWGGVVWGLLLVLFAGGMLFVLSAPERLAAVEVWLAALTPGTAWALWLAAAGVLIVVFALLGAIRSAQRKRAI